MASPPSAVPGNWRWIWTNPFGRLTQPGNIGTGTIDYYRFYANVTGNYAVTVTGALDSQLRIYGSSGAALTGIIDNANAGGTEIVSQLLTEGNYYIGVGGYNSSVGSYVLSVDGPA